MVELLLGVATSVLGVVTVVLAGLLVELLPTGVIVLLLLGRTLLSPAVTGVGLFSLSMVRVPETVTLFPPLALPLKELPVPVVPPARLS